MDAYQILMIVFTVIGLLIAVNKQAANILAGSGGTATNFFVRLSVYRQCLFLYKYQPTSFLIVKVNVKFEPQIDLNAFISKLANSDYEVQAAAMEEIANMVKDNPQKATELLDVKVMDTLNNIINTDSSKLAGPTQEQIAARQKLMNNEQLTDAEKTLATTITPMEQAERNKSYAMFTTAILQKLYSDEVAKLTNTTVPLTELPGAVAIVEQLKNNPNPMVRTSAIEALSYIQNPAYKADLNTLFTIAKNDQDKGVQEAANAALNKLNQLKDEQPAAEAKQVDITPNSTQTTAQAA